ncbi:hypothetical protein EKL30_08690 [Candidimonas sp. SYP-B2681]|uniref:hypothetical protein n=1 Tax=Candidimonas sp. SYP-B2681 TaxID=2497686 RepID=UPI000F89329F|nr:hypothetical protein [Candidimonas sp. SYP-B2681]RTZ44629.1 hypothetical protein EKL30_08690 [Candidimonas sp. SYP-B2681]
MKRSNRRHVTAAWEPDRRLPSPSSIDDLLPMRAAGLFTINASCKHPDTKHVRHLTDVALAPPMVKLRRNVFCVGRNDREYIIEGNRARRRDTATTPFGHHSAGRIDPYP